VGVFFFFGFKKKMSLPKPLGPYHVSFADFELRRSEENKGSRSGRAAEPEQQQIKRNGVHPNAANADSKAAAAAAPPMRIFYPTETKTRWSPWDVKERCWIPHYNYMWGYVARAFAPSSVFSRLGISVIACMFDSRFLSLCPLFIILLACPSSLSSSSSSPSSSNKLWTHLRSSHLLQFFNVGVS
jgi:hypothetical protein